MSASTPLTGPWPLRAGGATRSVAMNEGIIGLHLTNDAMPEPEMAFSTAASATTTVSAREQDGALRRLSQRSDWRAWAAITFDWAILVGAAVACEQFRWPGLYLLSIIVIARQMNALFELHHHAMHGNLFRRSTWNTRLQAFFSLPLGLTITSERDDHMEHHRTYNVARKDYQTWGEGYGLEPSRRHDRRYMIWFICIRPFVGPLQLAEVIETITTPRWHSRTYRWAVGGFWIAAAGAFYVGGHIGFLFWYWLVPRFTIYPILFFWDDMLGHYNCPKTGTREMRGLWFRVFAAHGTNFHNVHHLRPAIPWFNMRRATGLAIDESGVDVARGFVDGIRQLVNVQD